MLKALFEETDLVSGAVDSSADGLSLVPYGDTALTLGGELNKLAFNVISGRMWAGIHYRTDAAGLAFGEEVAICFLQDQVNTFTETFPGFAERSLKMQPRRAAWYLFRCGRKAADVRPERVQ